MEPSPNRPVNGISFTSEFSYISILYTSSCLILDFPFDRRVSNAIKRIPGAHFNTFGDKKWTLPKHATKALIDTLKRHSLERLLSLKNNDEIQRDAEFLSSEEETIEEVLNRIPKQIDATFMKLPPRNFQKVTMGWVATPKGKRGNVYGGILGDTMGLGKTIQALASAAYLRHTGKIKRCLIVTEAGLKGQWAEETERFTNESYVVIEGNGKANEPPFMHRRKLLERVQKEDIFYTITSYELLAQREVIGQETIKEKGKEKTKQIKGNYTDLLSILNNQYDMIILDEAQKIRNLQTQICQAVYEIQNPTYRLIMTGTPIENEIENIFPLIDYLSPNIFSSTALDVKKRLQTFEDKFLIKRLNPHALPQRVPEPVGTKNLSILNKLLTPYMLRRTIDDVSDEMPKANVLIERVDWEDHQFQFYNHIIETLKTRNEEWGEAYKAENAVFAQLENAKHSSTQSHKLRTTHEGLQKQRLLLENEVKALRLYALEVCNTPELLLWSESPIAHRLLLQSPFFAKIHKKAQKIRKDPALSEAQIEEKLHTLFEKEVPTVPKLQRFVDSIKEVCLGNQEKAITFTKFETMSRILERKVILLFNPSKKNKGKKDTAPLAQLYLYTGSTKKGCRWKSQLKKEKAAVENPPCSDCPFLNSCQTRRKAQWHLQNDPSTKLLIATDAANAGVNLQAARYNFNYDLPDSPSKYNQRNGRIQRLGSLHETVFFINLVTADGIDEVKYKRIMKKQENIDTAINSNDAEKLLISNAAEEMDDNFIDEINIADEQDLIESLQTIKK
ncbi:hypothetical protein CN918_27250 [Priestia megaterium]|nr:hypothetical protein CN918_27250 [Priestia megaterium]